MTHNTKFTGRFYFNQKVDSYTRELLEGLSKTRRMKRDIRKLSSHLMIRLDEAIQKYGIEGQLYFDLRDYGQYFDNSIMDYNQPPKGQPSLWCQWELRSDSNGDYLEWDGNDKFYCYIEWIQYIIDLTKDKYELNGTVSYINENFNDKGTINIERSTIL